MRYCEFCRSPDATRYGVPPVGEETYVLCLPCAEVTAASLRDTPDRGHLFTVRLDLTLPVSRAERNLITERDDSTEPRVANLSA